jgi:hypothetical protein
MSRIGIVLATAMVATTVVSASAHAAVTVTVSELAKLPGTTEQQAAAINDVGVIVGSSTVAGEVHAVRWAVDGTVMDLGGPESPSVKAKAINSAGVVAGEAKTTDSTVAVRFDLDGTHTVLSPVAGRNWVDVTGIDDSGAVYGYAVNTAAIGEPWIAVRWSVNGVPTPLALPQGARDSIVRSVARNGIATGSVQTAQGYTRAVRWNQDGSVSLLAGPPDTTTSGGDGVNALGDVVGQVETAGWSAQPFRWNANGSGAPFADKNGPALINDSGMVAGIVSHKAVRWDADGTKQVLSWPSGFYVGKVTGMNNAGVIVGYTRIDGGNAVKWS